jgi:hypothetical protein
MRVPAPHVYDDGKPIWIILDSYSMRRLEAAKEYVVSIGINLLVIPDGINAYGFGVMKSIQSKPWNGSGAASPQVLDESWSIHDESLESEDEKEIPASQQITVPI